MKDPDMKPDEWIVSKIVKHKYDPHRGWLFLTEWEGYDPDSRT